MKIKDLLERSGVQLLSGGCGEEEITALTYDSRNGTDREPVFLSAGRPFQRRGLSRRRPMSQGCRCFVSEGTLDVPEDADVVCGYRMPVRRWRRSRRRFSAFPGGM